jgi:hypothetical protein
MERRIVHNQNRLWFRPSPTERKKLRDKVLKDGTVCRSSKDTGEQDAILCICRQYLISLLTLELGDLDRCHTNRRPTRPSEPNPLVTSRFVYIHKMVRAECRSARLVQLESRCIQKLQVQAHCVEGLEIWQRRNGILGLFENAVRRFAGVARGRKKLVCVLVLDIPSFQHDLLHDTPVLGIVSQVNNEGLHDLVATALRRLFITASVSSRETPFVEACHIILVMLPCKCGTYYGSITISNTAYIHKQYHINRLSNQNSCQTSSFCNQTVGRLSTFLVFAIRS